MSWDISYCDRAVAGEDGNGFFFYNLFIFVGKINQDVSILESREKTMNVDVCTVYDSMEKLGRVKAFVAQPAKTQRMSAV